MIVVTGGAGFIGSNLVAALQDRGETETLVCDRLGGDDRWRNLARRELADLVKPEQRQSLAGLMDAVTLVPEAADERLPPNVELPPKDRPILTATLRAEASHLVTGDLTHFGPYLGFSVQGVRILTPAALLGRRRR